MPEPINLMLVQMVKQLERLRDQADASGGDLALLAYLLDMALIEARQQAGISSP